MSAAGSKRKANDTTDAAPKRVKAMHSSFAANDYIKADLIEMTQEELVEIVLEVQSDHNDALLKVAQLEAMPKVKELSKEDVAEKARKARELCYSGISKLMTRMLRLPDTHAEKQFKMPLVELDNVVGLPTKSIRFSYLEIKGIDVNLKWNEDDNTFKVSGAYGKQ